MNKVEVAFTFVRRFVVFGLGCWIIGNALLHPDERISQLIVGMVMVGVLPIENIFSWKIERRGPSENDQRYSGIDSPSDTVRPTTPERSAHE